MDNKYQLLNTLSGDEITVEAKLTKLNTKKLKNHFFCARVKHNANSSLSTKARHTSISSSILSSSEGGDARCTLHTARCSAVHTAHKTMGSVPCEANLNSKKSQIPPKEQFSQVEMEQETWFLQALEEFYVKLDLKEFTQKDIQNELYKNYWGKPYSETQAAHISDLARNSKYPVKNTFHPSNWDGEQGTGWSGPAEDSSCLTSTSKGWSRAAEESSCLASASKHTQTNPDIPVNPDKYAGHRIRQASQGLNTVQNLSPHKLRKIACWIKTGEFGMISEVGGVFGLQQPVLYPTQKCCHVFSPKTYDMLPQIAEYVMVTPFVQENQSAYITFANINGKEMIVTMDSGCTTSVATSTFIKNVFPNFYKLLKDYDGKPFITADNSELKIMGIMPIKISLGKLLFDMNLTIYEGNHSECLIGLDILKEKFNLLISPAGAYIKIEDLATHNKKQKVSKIGTHKNLQLVVSVRDQVSINAKQQKLIWVCIKKEDIQGLSLDNLLSDPYVCHSEDIDQLIMDEKK